MAETYKKTLKGTLGVGMSSLFGRPSNYYVLEHKVASKFHKLGEAQEIIVDYAEIGRDKTCAVRFDESFETVSRHHAAIVKKDGNWKLVQLSRTNSTLLNGHKITDEWYLQNGDEIQVSVNGPKLGFIIPEGGGKKTTMTLTHRLNLFGQQALRPYRNVIITLGVILLLAVVSGVGYGVYSNNKAEEAKRKLEKQLAAQQDSLVNQQRLLIQMTEELLTLTEELDSTKSKLLEEEKTLLKQIEKNSQNEVALKKLKQKQSDLQKEVQKMLEEKQQETERQLQENIDYINSFKVN